MAGLRDFSHSCSEDKVMKIDHKCSLKNFSFSDTECRTIWDFYVSRSFAAETGLSISLSDYGWSSTQSNTDGFPALERRLAETAGIESFCIVRSNTIKDTLQQMGLSQDRICTAHPRAVLMQNFDIVIDENENTTINSKESRINAIFRHIRNSFAYGNTYLFPNGRCLLEDKEGSKKITDEILLPCEALLLWIDIIDKERR